MNGRESEALEFIQEQKEATSAGVREWLRAHEDAFYKALEEFGRKMGEGFQALESAPEDEDSVAIGGIKKNMAKLETTPEEGEYTGHGLCGVVSSVLETVQREKFGDDIEVTTVRLATSNRDVDFENSDRTPATHHQHWIVRFQVKTDTQKYFIDATYRQFQWRMNPYNIMFIAPQEAEERLYNYRLNTKFVRLKIAFCAILEPLKLT